MLEKTLMAKRIDPAVRKYFSKIGRRGGNIGGTARAAALTPERRSEIARMGALARIAKIKESAS